MSSPEFPEIPLNLPNFWKFTQFWGKFAGNICGKSWRERNSCASFPARIWLPFGDLKTTPVFSGANLATFWRPQKRPPFFRRPFRDLKTTPVLAPGISRPFRDLKTTPLFRPGVTLGPPWPKTGGARHYFLRVFLSTRVHHRAGSGKNTGPPSGRLGQKYGSTIGPARAKTRVHPRAGSGKNTGPPSGRLGHFLGPTPRRALGRGGVARLISLICPAPTSPFPGFPSVAPFCAVQVRMCVWVFFGFSAVEIAYVFLFFLMNVFLQGVS